MENFENDLEKPKRVICLDVDGPVIPSYQFVIDKMASLQRVFSPSCVAFIKLMVERSNANGYDTRIVMNTYHNLEADGLHASLVEYDMSKYLYGDNEVLTDYSWQTSYPHNGEERMNAINLWLKQYEPVGTDWIALDDEDFGPGTGHEDKIFLVDYDHGVCPKIYRQVAKCWKIPSFLVL